MTRLVTRITGWPLLVIVICLAILSLMAPSIWVRHSEREIAQQPHQFADASVALTEPQETVTPSEIQTAEIPLRAPQLSDFAVARQTSQLHPPVAERIDLDPSVAETPALPPVTPNVQVPNTIRPMSNLDTSPIGDEPSANADSSGALPPATAPGNEPAAPVQAQPIPSVTITDMPRPTSFWPYPASLAASLELLRAPAETQAWAEQVLSELETLKHVESLSDTTLPQTLSHLRKLAADAKTLASQVAIADARARLLHVAYAVSRRVEMWEQATQIARQPATEPLTLEPATLANLTQAVDARVRQLSNAASWREFLMVAQIRDLVASTPFDVKQLRPIARRVLIRMDAPALSDPQYAFFREPLFEQYATELKRWADEAIDFRELLVDVEHYESSLATSDAQQVAKLYQIIRWSPSAPVAKLGETMNMHYRNANVRVAVSVDLINRMIPDTQPIEEDVDDEILGARVLGRSLAATRLRVTLFPDRNHWRLGLFANGNAISETESYKGGAVFRNDGSAQFQARKMLLIDRRGVRTGQAEADADVQSELRDFETELDGVPLIGMFARSIARQQYEEKSAMAQGEMRDRIAWRASSRFDTEVQRRLAQAEKQFQEKLLRPLHELDLKPTAVDMETTESRLIVRERLAGHEQLGAHTPRPQAPGSSWLSVQIHESALNNALEHLHLDGKRTDLHSLFREMTSRFDRPDAKIPEDLPEDVTVHFAETDSVRIHCDSGRVTLTVRLQELSQTKGNTWKNFVIKAHYKPLSDQIEANLARDGVIELAGERLSFGDQVKLRGIFSKILSRNTTIAVVNKKLRENPRLADFVVNQFVVENGWIGVAVEPGVTAKSGMATPRR